MARLRSMQGGFCRPPRSRQRNHVLTQQDGTVGGRWATPCRYPTHDGIRPAITDGSLSPSSSTGQVARVVLPAPLSIRGIGSVRKTGRFPGADLVVGVARAHPKKGCVDAAGGGSGGGPTIGSRRGGHQGGQPPPLPGVAHEEFCRIPEGPVPISGKPARLLCSRCAVHRRPLPTSGDADSRPLPPLSMRHPEWDEFRHDSAADHHSEADIL